MSSKSRGLFIVVEGADGTGKTSVAKKVAEELQDQGISAVYTSEPFQEDYTYNLVKDLMHQYSQCDNDTERDVINRHLILALSLNRSFHAHSLWASLWSGDVQVVVCDRYYYSTLVYQGILSSGTRTDNISEVEETIFYIDDIHAGFQMPDYTFFIDCDAETQLSRIKARGLDDDFDTKYSEAALIAYRNLAEDLGKATLFTQTKWFGIIKRSPVYVVDNSASDISDAVALVKGVIESKLKHAKYQIKSKKIIDLNPEESEE